MKTTSLALAHIKGLAETHHTSHYICHVKWTQPETLLCPSIINMNK